MKVRVVLLIALLLVVMSSFVGAYRSAEAKPTLYPPCTPGQYDMIDWMTMDPGLDNHLAINDLNDVPLYTYVQADSSKIYFMKGPGGYPWDIWISDGTYIYWWATEGNYTDPRSYSKAYSNYNFKATPRCATIDSSPSNIFANSNSATGHYDDCTWWATTYVGYTIFDLWGPLQGHFGDLGTEANPIDYLILSYRWNCNSDYSVCGCQEKFYFSKKYGWFKWTRTNLVADPSINCNAPNDDVSYYHLRPGRITPYFPCQ